MVKVNPVLAYVRAKPLEFPIDPLELLPFVPDGIVAIAVLFVARKQGMNNYGAVRSLLLDISSHL